METRSDVYMAWHQDDYNYNVSLSHRDGSDVEVYQCNVRGVWQYTFKYVRGCTAPKQQYPSHVLATPIKTITLGKEYGGT